MADFKTLCKKYNASIIQKLYKKITNEDGTLTNKDVFPASLVQAVYDAISGMRLDDILTHYNYLNVDYKGTDEKTRLAIPIGHRRDGLIISYKDYENNRRIEEYIGTTINDNDWKNPNNWKAPFTGGNYTVYITNEQLGDFIDKEELEKMLKEALEGLDIESKIDNSINNVLNEYIQSKDEYITNLINEYINEHLTEEQLEEFIVNAIKNNINTVLNNYFNSEEGKEVITNIFNEIFGPQLEELIGAYFEELFKYVQDNERIIANALARHEQAITDLQNS